MRLAKLLAVSRATYPERAPSRPSHSRQQASSVRSEVDDELPQLGARRTVAVPSPPATADLPELHPAP